MKCFLNIGYLFVFIVSVIALFYAENVVVLVLLILSSIVSFVLAIIQLSSSKRINNRIEEIEANQLSVRVDEEGETVIVEKKNKS